MAFHIASKEMLPIGLDLGSSAVKLVQLRTVKGGVELAANGYIEIPRHIRKDPIGRLDFFSQKIPRVLRGENFKGNKCILGLPPESTFVRHVKVPRLDPKNTEAAVRRAAQKELPYPVNEAVIRHIVAGEVYSDGETRQEVIVVAIPLSTMDAYLNMTNRVGLQVVGVNVEPLAIVECFTGLFEWGRDPERAILYVDLGSQNTQVVISHGKDVVFARNMPRGSEQVEQAIARAIEVSPEEVRQIRRDLQVGKPAPISADELYGLLEPWLMTMVEEFETCLRYYNSVFRRSGVDRVIFTGGQAMDKRLCQIMAQRLNLPAQIGDPMVGVVVPGGKADEGTALEGPQPGLAVGIGLSLSGKHR